MSNPILPNVVAMSFEEMIKSVSPRNKDAHKGDFGHALLVGGNTGFAGAIRLSAEATLRVGSGLVSVATRHEHVAVMAMSRPELMCHGVENQAQLKKLTKQSNVIALGPGLGQDAWSIQVFEAVLESNKLMVLDADALNLLAKAPRKNSHWLLTPHVGEDARLLNCTTADIQQDRAAAITQLQQQYGGVIVLKGSDSLVLDRGEDIFVCHAGNPGMASGGMGDVLTGVIAGLIAQGLSLIDAAKLGVMIHAMAGDRAAMKCEKGLIASDLMQFIRELINDY
jgi:NAD(P)H-hydrate epimerase